MSEPTYRVDPQTWEQLADRKAVELIESVDLVVVTNRDYERLVSLVGAAYLLGRRDEVKESLDIRRGDEA